MFNSGRHGNPVAHVTQGPESFRRSSADAKDVKASYEGWICVYSESSSSSVGWRSADVH